MLEKERRPEFARMLSMNISRQIFDYLRYKVKMRENVNVAFKGETRSGKSTAGLAISTFICSLTGVPLDVNKHICANESETDFCESNHLQEYYQRVQNAEFNEVYQIDEQKEAKFGIGSFREEMSIQDIQNILAKKCIHTIWIYPTDNEHVMLTSSSGIHRKELGLWTAKKKSFFAGRNSRPMAKT